MTINVTNYIHARFNAQTANIIYTGIKAVSPPIVGDDVLVMYKNSRFQEISSTDLKRQSALSTLSK